jgi:hypothetical protein
VNSTGLHGGGSGDGQEPPQPAADDSEWHKAGDGTRHLECEQKRRRWTPYLAAMLRVRSPSQQGKESIYSKSPSPPSPSFSPERPSSPARLPPQAQPSSSSFSRSGPFPLFQPTQTPSAHLSPRLSFITAGRARVSGPSPPTSRRLLYTFKLAFKAH